MIGLVIALGGGWILQDALASIAFYPKEKWMWNHTARLIRALWGVVLIWIGVMLV